MATVSGEIKVYPGKEMKAVDMAEALEGAFISDYCILQGCVVSLNGGKLSITSGSIIIKGRVATVTGGDIDDYPTVSSTSDLKLLAVCDLTADTPFYIRLFSQSEYETLAARRDNVADFNSGNGIEFMQLGTATFNPATSQVTKWTANSDSVIKQQNKDAYQALSSTVGNNDAAVRQLITTNVNTINSNAASSHNLLTQKINAWATYLQKRTSSADRFSVVQFTVPSFTIGAGARVGCTFPAIRGTTFRATGTNARTETRPSWSTFTQTYTTLSDGTKIPLNVDDATVRYFAVGISQILMSNAAYQSKGKNANKCVVTGWALYGADYDRRGAVYVRNVGTAEAIIDLTITLTFVRRG